MTAEATQENQLKKLSARSIPDGEGGFKRYVIERTPTGFAGVTERDKQVRHRCRLRQRVFLAVNPVSMADA